ncbi:Succinate-semialdehyde dehydrogenase, mitochondrial [Liparis tanakae]|uniref:Succinate-semialdehyde dehydrogenase, mitochondrial n=1 Tax=Liparis tanakae TaxID=230148 RepID=A0A4Z2E6K8_9TELE|nr:Succinate-semialdehyde dehydrogenase, mitochondrial [Liparis tanakae]
MSSRCLLRLLVRGPAASRLLVRGPAAMQRHYSLDVSAPLLRTRGYVDGRWVSAASDFPVLDPATGEEVARVADCGPAEAKRAVDAAHRAFQSWKRTTAKVRPPLHVHHTSTTRPHVHYTSTTRPHVHYTSTRPLHVHHTSTRPLHVHTSTRPPPLHVHHTSTIRPHVHHTSTTTTRPSHVHHHMSTTTRPPPHVHHTSTRPPPHVHSSTTTRPPVHPFCVHVIPLTYELHAECPGA